MKCGRLISPSLVEKITTVTAGNHYFILFNCNALCLQFSKFSLSFKGLLKFYFLHDCSHEHSSSSLVSCLGAGLPFQDLQRSANVIFQPCVTGSVLSSWWHWLQLPQPQNPAQGVLIHRRCWTNICSTDHRVQGADFGSLNLDLMLYLQKKKVFCSQDENQSSSDVLLGTWKVLILEYPWFQKR